VHSTLSIGEQWPEYPYESSALVTVACLSTKTVDKFVEHFGTTVLSPCHIRDFYGSMQSAQIKISIFFNELMVQLKPGLHFHVPQLPRKIKALFLWIELIFD
jgi:hypothetical protein